MKVKKKQYRNLFSKVFSTQELSGAKSELRGGTVGVCSSYKRGSQPPYKCALRSMQMYFLVHIYKWSISK